MIKKLIAAIFLTLGLVESLIASTTPSDFDFTETEASREFLPEEVAIQGGNLQFQHNDIRRCLRCRDENSFSFRLENELNLNCQLWNYSVAPVYVQHDFMTGLVNRELEAQRPQIQCPHAASVQLVREGGFVKELFIRDFAIIERFLSNMALSNEDIAFLWPKLRWIEVANISKGKETIVGKAPESFLLGDIPREVLFNVLTYLDIRSLARLSQTCHLFGGSIDTEGLVCEQRLNRLGRVRAKILEEYYLPSPCLETRLAFTLNPLALLVARIKARAIGIDLDAKLQESAKMVAKFRFQLEDTKAHQCNCPHGDCSTKVHWICYGRVWQFFGEKLGVLRNIPREEQQDGNNGMPAQPQLFIPLGGQALILPMQMMLPFLMAMGGNLWHPQGLLRADAPLIAEDARNERGLRGLFEQIRLREAANAPIVMPAEDVNPAMPEQLLEDEISSSDEEEVTQARYNSGRYKIEDVD